MEKKKLNFVVLRAARLVFLLVAIILIITGAGVRLRSYSTWRVASYVNFPITEWRNFPNLLGQYFPLITCLSVFLEALVMLIILFSRRNLQAQYRQGILVTILIWMVLLLVATCVEVWYAAGGGVYITYYHIRETWWVVRVNGWIAAVVFMLLSILDLALDAFLTYRG